MILAHRIPDLANQLRAATLRAAVESARDVERVRLLVETAQLEQRLAVCYAELGVSERRAA
jgi:hypothetical protein